MTDNARGALLMMAAMLAFLINDTMMKTLSKEVPVMQVIALRGIFATALMIPVVYWQRVRLWGYERPDSVRVAIRALAEAVSAGLYITALFQLPIANATAILAALPLTVTLAGALFLHEPVGWRRITAIAIGFLGVILIVRPGTAGFSPWSLVVLASVFTVTMRELFTRNLSTHVPSFAVAFWTALGVAVAALLAAWVVGDWVSLSLRELVVLLGAAVFLVGGYLFSVMAMRVGDIAAVSPFRYASILFAVALGIVVLREWPDLPTLAGSALVTATGMFTLLRERRVAPRPPPPLDLRLR